MDYRCCWSEEVIRFAPFILWPSNGTCSASIKIRLLDARFALELGDAPNRCRNEWPPHCEVKNERALCTEYEMGIFQGSD